MINRQKLPFSSFSWFLRESVGVVFAMTDHTLTFTIQPPQSDDSLIHTDWFSGVYRTWYHVEMTQSAIQLTSHLTL